MRHTAIFVFSLFLAVAAGAQSRMPKGLSTPGGDDEAGEEEPVQYRASLAGVDQLVLNVLEPSKVLSKCTSKAELETLLARRFKEETNAPKLGSGPKDGSRAVLEVWIDAKEDAPDLFRKAKVSDDDWGLALRMRVTTAKPAQATALEGETIWWGPAKECKEGVTKGAEALLDRFFAEYRTANPGRRLPADQEPLP